MKPGKDRDNLSRLLEREGYIPVWIDPTLVRSGTGSRVHGWQVGVILL